MNAHLKFFYNYINLTKNYWRLCTLSTKWLHTTISSHGNMLNQWSSKNSKSNWSQIHKLDGLIFYSIALLRTTKRIVRHCHTSLISSKGGRLCLGCSRCRAPDLDHSGCFGPCSFLLLTWFLVRAPVGG